MELSRKQFDVLEALIEHPNTSQRELADITGYSLGLINNTLKELNDKNETYVNGLIFSIR